MEVARHGGPPWEPQSAQDCHSLRSWGQGPGFPPQGWLAGWLAGELPTPGASSPVTLSVVCGAAASDGWLEMQKLRAHTNIRPAG